MATENERKALWFLALVALSGAGVRLFRATDRVPDEAAIHALDRQVARADSARTRAANRPRGPIERPRSSRGKRATGSADTQSRVPSATGRALAPAMSPQSPGPVDLDRATAREIEALPWIGPALAARIVENRDSAGSFGGLDALCDVRGIGPTLAERLRPLVTFSGARRPVSDGCDAASSKARMSPAARRRNPG